VSVPDPYKVLQVDPEAEEEVIEAAYRRLARKYHPDVSPGPESQERMVRINQAWELLRDPTKRAAVDRARLRISGAAAQVASADARAAAADARARAAAGHPPTPPGSTVGPDRRYAPTGVPPAPAPTPEAGPIDGTGQATGVASPDWAGSGFGQAAASAGPPPGKPSGSVLNFGRYAGWSLGEIARTDLEYLEWLDRMPIGRLYQGEVDDLLRSHGRRVSTTTQSEQQRGLFRRR
jgi:curved DNA-binding protein CbpA